MTLELQDRVVNRLIESGDADKPLALVVLAALEGESALATYLDGATTPALPTSAANPAADTAVEPPGVYVSSIAVEGLRGVGQPATLNLHAGPGLTLVIGRNGSGKSSFAEGLELLLTGRNARWSKRPKAWLEGWRNLHDHSTVKVTAGLVVEGRGPLTVSRVWTGDDPDDSTATAKTPSGTAQSLASLGWDEALTTFRPFLSYNELGSLLEDGPSKLYDALSSVLGLDELTNVQTTIANARKERLATVDEAKEGAATLRENAETAAQQSADDRLANVVKAIDARPRDLAALDALVRDTGHAQLTHVELLRRLTALQVPDVAAISVIVDTLRTAECARAALAGTSAERSRERARLLDEALRFTAKQPSADCPVCGTASVISSAWREASTQEVARLRQEATDCEAAHTACTTALREAQRQLTAPPPALAEAADLNLGALPAVREHWVAWSAGRDIEAAGALADHLETHVLEFADAVTALVDEAREEVRRRDDVWRPVADVIIEWLPCARAAVQSAARLPEIKAAEAWWKDALAAIRTERFAPIAERALAVWKQLRLQSNVDLDAVELGGAAQRRRVDLHVTVDGTEAGALGVMSQGELHSLALSLFLPRVTLSESPFRFISIDDPVQSMDPARVEGLARVLADTARTRQVIVFTHDDRLPDATRRLGIPATVLGVTRRAGSVVDVRQTADPVRSYLDDARAVALTGDLPAGVAKRVVPGFCRSAIEAACMDVVRRRRLARGDRHEDVEELLTVHARPHPLMALALLDDETKTGDVLSRLNRAGKWAVDAFQACKLGAHESYDGDLTELIRSTERLADVVAREVR